MASCHLPQLQAALLVALCSFAALTAAQDFVQVKVTDIDSKAVCNDGSPGMYFFRPGTGTGANKWVLRMEGGGWCSDAATCASRLAVTPLLMSSTSFLPTLPSIAVAGVLNADPNGNPYMYNWNQVFVVYCSSDSFLGDAGPKDSAQAGAYQFRGKRIITAVIRSLIATKNITTATDILVSGESAGGVAAMNNAGMIQSMVAPLSKSLTNFKCLVDAGWFQDLPSYTIAANAWTFKSNAQGLQNNWNATFDLNCTAQYGQGMAWACFFAQYAWPYIPVPLLFHEFLYDTANLNFDGAATENNMEDFRAKLTISLKTPAAKVTGPQRPTATASQGQVQTLSIPANATALPNVFAPAKSEHTVIDNIFFPTSNVGTTVFPGVLNAWFTGQTPTVQIIDAVPGISNQ